MTERDVQIQTSDGLRDAAFFHSASGSHPGVLIWADAFGLRPAMRDIGRRLAAAVHRRQRLQFAESRRCGGLCLCLDRLKTFGTQGYCMEGPLVVRTAAALPDRIGAGASFHGGGLATDKPDSPHLLAPKIKARMCFRDRVQR